MKNIQGNEKHDDRPRRHGNKQDRPLAVGDGKRHGKKRGDRQAEPPRQRIAGKRSARSTDKINSGPNPYWKGNRPKEAKWKNIYEFFPRLSSAISLLRVQIT